MNLKLEFESFQDFAARLWPCLSEEGMWVATDEPAEVGELVDFDVALADGFRLFHGSGQVVNAGQGPGSPAVRGVAIRFWELDQASRNLLRKVVRKHVGEGGAPFVLGSVTAPGAPAGGDALEPPFPELDQGRDFGASEPGLTSFLSAAPAASEAAGPAGWRDPVPGGGGDPPGAEEAGDDRAPDARPAARRPTFSQMSTSFEEVLAETQRVEPLAEDDDDVRRAAEAISFEPDPGWAPLPSLGHAPATPPAAVELDDSFESESIEMPGRRRRRRGWGAWTIVGLIAVAAGVFVAGQFDTPIAGWLGGGEAVEEPVPTEAAPAAAARDGDVDRSAQAPEETLEGEAETDAAQAAAAPAEIEAAVAELAPRDETEAGTPPEAETSTPPEAEAEPAGAAAAPPVDRPTASAADPLRLLRVTWIERDGDTVVRLWLSGAASADGLETLRLRDGPPRTVLKIAGVAGGVPTRPLPIGSPHVVQLRFGLHPGAGGGQLHVVADLGSADVEVAGAPAIDADGVELRFTR